MLRFIGALALTFGIGISTVAAQSDNDGLSAAERDAVRAEIHRYIEQNPEHIRDVLQQLEREEQSRTQTKTEGDRNRGISAEDVGSGRTVPSGLDVTRASTGNVLPSVGPSDAAVTIVEFFDYNCPHCRKFADPLQKLLNERDDVRIVFRPTPIMARSSTYAHAAALAVYDNAGSAAYKEVYRTFMDTDGKLTSERIYAEVESYGVTESEVKERLQGDIRKTLRRNLDLMKKTAGELLTPVFIVDGQVFKGGRSYEELTRIVDAAKDG